jgi:hypothetical protein
MARLNYTEFYPKNCPQELYEKKIKILKDSEQRRWNNFKNRISRSNFIKNNLKKRQLNICPICSKYLNENIVVHHIDYDRLFDFESYQRQKSPTIKKPNREIKIPNCDNCPSTNKCLDKLVLIHNICHMILHKKEGRINGKTEKQKKKLR